MSWFKDRYRVLEYNHFHDTVFEPQVWKWWYPVWHPIMNMQCYDNRIGSMDNPVVYYTFAQAVEACRCYKMPIPETKPVKPIGPKIHKVTI